MTLIKVLINCCFEINCEIIKQIDIVISRLILKNIKLLVNNIDKQINDMNVINKNKLCRDTIFFKRYFTYITIIGNDKTKSKIVLVRVPNINDVYSVFLLNKI